MKWGVERGRGEGGIEEGREAGMEEELHKTNPILHQTQGQVTSACVCFYCLMFQSTIHRRQCTGQLVMFRVYTERESG